MKILLYGFVCFPLPRHCVTFNNGDARTQRQPISMAFPSVLCQASSVSYFVLLFDVQLLSVLSSKRSSLSSIHTTCTRPTSPLVTGTIICTLSRISMSRWQLLCYCYRCCATHTTTLPVRHRNGHSTRICLHLSRTGCFVVAFQMEQLNRICKRREGIHVKRKKVKYFH